MLGVLGAVPVASGTAGILLGPGGLPGAEPPGSTIDSEYRFVNVFWLAAGVMLWWSLRQPEQRSTVTRLVFGLASLGAGPRLLSWARTGPPHLVFKATLVLELVVVPIVLSWHACSGEGTTPSAESRSAGQVVARIGLLAIAVRDAGQRILGPHLPDGQIAQQLLAHPDQ